MSIKTIMSDVNKIVSKPAKALQIEGRKNRNVIYFTADIPIEIITAAGCIPYRIPSDLEVDQGQTTVTSVLQPFICSKSHQFFEFISKNNKNLAAGIFSENHCDSLQNLYDVIQLNKSLDPDFTHFRFLLPIKRGGKTETKYYYKELKRLISWFEGWTGEVITYEKLFDAIKLHNFKRMALKEISQHIQVSGEGIITMAEFVKLKIVTDIIPVIESTNILHSVLEDLNRVNSKPSLRDTLPRVLISGSMFDNYRLFDSIDILNEAAVATDLSFISRSSDFQVPLPQQSNNENIDNLLHNLASAYIVDKTPDSVHHYPGKRRDHLAKQIDDNKIDGVIFIHYSFCDPDAFESRSLARYVENKKGIPTITIVTDPQLTNINQMTTRVEAFLEKIGDT